MAPGTPKVLLPLKWQPVAAAPGEAAEPENEDATVVMAVGEEDEDDV